MRAQRLSASLTSAHDGRVATGGAILGAQRLSASLTSALRALEEDIAQSGCSTPFGISDFGTVSLTVDVELFFSAQRLSASLTSAHQKARRCPRLIARAQRLSASLTSALGLGHSDVEGAVCSTPFGISDFGTALVVRDCAIGTSITSVHEHLQRTFPSADRCSRPIPLGSATPSVLPPSTALKDLPDCQRALTLQPARGCSLFTVSPVEQAPMLESSVPAYTI